MFGQKQLRYLAPILLIIVLATAAGLRFYNLNWDNGIFAHPDERSTVAFYAPTIEWPENSADLLDPRASRLNPFWNVDAQERRSYTYGHFPLYTLVLVAHFLAQLAPLAQSLGLPPDWIQFLSTAQSGQGYALIGRALTALADVFTVYLIFLIGRRLYGIWGGLLAAALSTFTVLQIQLAHFFAVDPITTTFTMLALYGSIRLYDHRSLGAALLTGVGIGLAVASKFSALPVVLVPVVAGLLAIRHAHRKAAASPTPSDQAESSSLRARMMGLVLAALAVSFVVFAVNSPFVLLDFENFKRAVIDEQGNMVSGVADFPFTRQYRGTPAYWYFIEQQLRWGMGWPLGLLALAGTLWVVLKAVRGRAQVGEILCLTWIVLYFGPTGLFLAKFMRYMIPIVPLFTLFGAGLVIALWRWGTKNKPVTEEAGEAELTQSPSPQPSLKGRGSETSPSLGGIEGGVSAKTEPTVPHPKSSNLPISQSPLLPKLAKPTALVIAAVALLGSMIWSLAFVNGVYGSDHTWVTFSRWVYENVPDGSCLAFEHWDDRLPTNLPEPNGNPGAHGFYQPQLPMYDDDTQQKYELIRSTLTDCDYIVLATNRLWRTIPGLPERYPMSTRYYEALFSGELGFELAYTAETPPTLGPLIIDTQPADESFTVYDHPKPMLFKKTRQLSEAEWDNLLGGTWEQAQRGYVGDPTIMMRIRSGQNNQPPPAQLQGLNEAEKTSLMLDRAVDKLQPITDYRWNDLANQSTLVAVILWWVVVMLVGLLAWPLTFLLFNKLPDRGYGLSKSFGLLAVSYLVWLSSSLVGLRWLGNSAVTAIMALILVAIINGYIFVRIRAQLVDFLVKQRGLILATEALFGTVFLIFVYLRILNPDLWHPWLGGEKMLEIGFLNAIVKSVEMPPYDPFFAGGIINYYYYGLFIVGVLIKVTGIQPAIAFNLAVPTLAALTAVNAFGLAGNLAASGSKATLNSPVVRLKAIAAGLFAVIFVVFMGNLEGAAQFLRNLADMNMSNVQTSIPGINTLLLAAAGLIRVLGGDAIAVYNYWDPTRVIPETINEFPYFSFLFADLHPHMIGIPFTILFLSLAFNWILPANRKRTEQSSPSVDAVSSSPALLTSKKRFGPSGGSTTIGKNSEWSRFTQVIRSVLNSLLDLTPASVLRWLALPFVLGAIAVINTWDLPTYLGLMLATFLLARYRRLNGGLSLSRIATLILSGLLFAAALLAATYLLYLPFFANYQAPAETGLGIVRNKTALDQHLKIWGFFLFVIGSWLWLSLLWPKTRHGLLRTVSLFLRRWNVWPHLSQIYRSVVKRETDVYQLGLWGIGLLLAITVLLFLLGYRVPAYLLPFTAVTLILLFRREVPAATAYLSLLAFTGFLILLGVEFFFLRDFLGGGAYYRMNTLFKFFIQVWIMFGLVAAVVLPQLWDMSTRWRVSKAVIWRSAVMLLLLASLVYPVLGTRTRVDDRFPGLQNRPPSGTLDGLAYMSAGIFEWPAGNPIELKYDYEAIRWLQENVRGTPILAEAKIGYYREGGMRVAAYTGLPSILGGLHQNEQRPASQIGERDFVVNELWNTPDPARALELIDELDISYIYLGQVERATYGENVGDKFEQLQSQGQLELVFENAETRIYKRVENIEPSVSQLGEVK